ncbi:MAG: bifunctional homocysteine S-methyltransferase/methylenetetrahydrofolate reductase [Pseudomonadota bacterium]
MKPAGSRFLDRVRSEILVGDGAFGTRLYELGIGFETSYEQFNLTRPELVELILREYAQAGAMVLETNTFCLNRHKQRIHGLDGQIREMARSAARISRKVAGPDRFVAGSIGPVSRKKRDLDEFSPDDLKAMFREPMEVLVEEGADVLILETFSSLTELELALEVALGMDVPVVCQMAFGEEGTTALGVTCERAAERLTELGAHVVGTNCRSGPLVQREILDRMARATSLPLSVFPNAGYAQQVDGRYIYQAAAQHFGEQVSNLVAAGATLIGGCCGTTADHVHAIADAAKNLKASRRAAVSISRAVEEAPMKLRRSGEKFLSFLAKQGPFVTVEISPPRDTNPKKALEGARKAAQAGCDAFNVPDNPLAHVRMDNVIFADLLRQRVELPVILHLTCRDKNTIALQGAVLGAQAAGVDAILALTGDPAAMGDQPGATSVYDINSIGLVDLIASLNRGVTPSGRVLDGPTDLAIGVALNPNLYGEEGLDRALKRLRKKIEAGAQFVETQPMYDPELLRALLEPARRMEIPIMLGVMPIMSRKNAEFFHNEVPGLKIPKEIRDRFEGLDREQGQAEGIRQAKAMIDIAREGGIRHFYLIPPLERFEVVVELARYIRTGR